VTTNPFDQFAKLAGLLAEKAAELGLKQATFLPVIDPSPDGQHVIQVMFILEGGMAGEDVPELEADPEMAAILSGIVEATAEEERQKLHDLKVSAEQEAIQERIARARDMQHKLSNGGGFLDD